MSDAGPSPAELEALSRFDTPTVCNGLEVTNPERRATGFTIEHLHCLIPGLIPIVGHVRTARIRAAAPSAQDAAEARAMRADYYAYIASAPGPTVVVIEDLDPVPGFGAFWGEVNTAIHKGLGCLGVVTNGSFRDVDDCAPGFQILGGKIGPSHAHVHLVDFGEPVTVAGMAARHGDLIHADRHGAVIVPPDAVTALPAAIDLLTRREAVILKAARGEGFNAGVLKQAMANSADIH